MINVTRWRNIGVWVDTNLMPGAGIRTPWGNVMVHRWKDALFSDRYGYSKLVRIGPWYIKWARLRAFEDKA